jgi:hypothetical protein
LQLWHELELAIASNKERDIPIVKFDGVPFRIDRADDNSEDSESSGLDRREHCVEGRKVVGKSNRLNKKHERHERFYSSLELASRRMWIICVKLQPFPLINGKPVYICQCVYVGVCKTNPKEAASARCLHARHIFSGFVLQTGYESKFNYTPWRHGTGSHSVGDIRINNHLHC